MKKSSRVLILILITIYLCSNVTFAANITIDGNIKTYEWCNAQVDTVVPLNGESNCNINNAFIYYDYLPESKDIYLALISVEKKDFDNLSSCGVILRVNGEKDIILETGKKEYSTELYDVDFGYTTGNGNEMHYEIRIGLKENYYNDIYLEFCYIDSQGSRSNFYNYKLFDAEQTTSEMSKTTVSHSTEKTTKEKKTTKKSSGKSSYSKYTTKKYTTRSSSNSGNMTRNSYGESNDDSVDIDDSEFETKIVSAEPVKNGSATEKYIIIASSAVLLIGAGVILVSITGSKKK